MRAAVFRVWMYSSVSAGTAFPSDCTSTTWPPTIPSVPAAPVISARTRGNTSGAALPRPKLTATRPSAWVRSASPASTAIASPKTLWFVRRPRR